MEVEPPSGIGWNDAPNLFPYNEGYLVEYSQPAAERRAGSLVAFFDDFDGNLSTGTDIAGSYSGVTSTESVGGYAALGTGTNSFSGNLLRNQSGMAFAFQGVPQSPVVRTTLHLTGLPQHESVNVNFLLAAIDSWDGNTEYAAPDVFNVALDGSVIFSETLDHLYFHDQTYQPPVGVLLAHGSNLEFSEFSDAAYNLGLDRRLDRIPHTASELTIEFFASGAGWSAAYGDESWGIDNLEILLNGTAADYNANGIVDAADFVVWRKSLGQIGSGLVADGNGNLSVEPGDYELWRVNFGKSAIVSSGSIGSSSAGTPAPEPSTGLLVALAIAAYFTCRSLRPGDA